jgi:hypothetical protein
MGSPVDVKWNDYKPAPVAAVATAAAAVEGEPSAPASLKSILTAAPSLAPTG